MAYIATTNARVQIGRQSAFGTGVAANRQMVGWSIDAEPDEARELVPAMGQPVPIHAGHVGKKTTRYNVRIDPAYASLIYVLESMTLEDASSPYVYDLPVGAIGDPKFLTLEYGEGSTAEKAIDCFTTGFTMQVSPSAISFESQMIGAAYTVGQTITASPLPRGTLPMDPTRGTLTGGTDHTSLAAFAGNFQLNAAIQGVRGPVFETNAAKASHSGVVQLQYEINGSLIVGVGTLADSLLTTYLRNGTAYFLGYTVDAPSSQGSFDVIFQTQMQACAPVDFEGNRARRFSWRGVNYPVNTLFGVPARFTVAENSFTL